MPRVLREMINEKTWVKFWKVLQEWKESHNIETYLEYLSCQSWLLRSDTTNMISRTVTPILSNIVPEELLKEYGFGEGLDADICNVNVSMDTARIQATV